MQEQEPITQEPKELTTEVTSIAKEEEKTGEKIHIPSQQELVTKATGSLIAAKKELNQLAWKMSKKQLIRAVNAIVDIPMDGLPVTFKEPIEKYFFAVAQRAQSDKFLLIYNHIVEEQKKKVQAMAEVPVEENKEQITQEQQTIQEGDKTNE